MSETATASIAVTPIDATTFSYTITLQDTGSTPIGTFWFAWDDFPDQDFMPSAPLSVSSPTGWSSFVTHGGPTDGYGIEWNAGAGSALQAGGSLATFQFTSHVTPTELASASPIDPGFAMTSSFVYQGFAFSDAGFNFAASVACIRAGTRIATPHGPCAIERLRAGDRIVTPDGRQRVIVWVGHRQIDCARHPRPHEVWPVRIAAQAFGENRPCADLDLSPDHGVLCDGVLVPAGRLINGTTIMQVPVPTVHYHHIELDRHDILLAEGLAVESYLDTDDHAAFPEGGRRRPPHPAFSAQVREAMACAPLVVTGPMLDDIRARLAAAA